MATKVWSGFSETIHNSDTDTIEFNDLVPTVPCTLLRSLIWVNFAGYNLYDIGSGGLPLSPQGYAFGDLNSVHHSGFSPENNPGNARVELIAYDEITPQYSALGWAPNSTATLTGSINEISSDASIDTNYNVNTFLYGSGRSFVDSQAQRLFEEIPTYSFVNLFFAATTPLIQGDWYITFTWRGLYNQA